MKIRIFVISLAMSFLTAGMANAFLPTVEVIEDAYELSADNADFPSTETGTLRVTPCDDCDTVLLRITGQSRAFLGKAEVTMGELKKAAENSESPMYVFFRFGTDEVTRVVLDTTS